MVMAVPSNRRRLVGGGGGQTDEDLEMKYLAAFLRDESGATAIEYGLIAAGISIAIITVVKNVGTNLSGTFTSVQNALQ